MNDVTRDMLTEIIAQHGPGLCDDPRRCEGLLKDLCGEHKREIFVVVSAIKEGVPADLVSATKGLPIEALIARLTQRLCDNLALSEAAALWAVETWAIALGNVSDAELLAFNPPTPPGTGVQPTQATVAPLSNTTRVNPVDGAEMIWIPAGDFVMGERNLINNPRRTVTLAGYWMYKNVVTVGMYKRFCQEARRTMAPAPDFNWNWSKEDHPIVNVSWHDAEAYCQWASVSLPSEAQWERAARGIDARVFPWGDTFEAEKLWCSYPEIRIGTAAVGFYGVSPCGCSDMAGNVWQWCIDYFHESYWKRAPSVDLKGPSSGDFHVMRGGSWNDAGCLPASYRDHIDPYSYPDRGNDHLGFRCAADP